MNRQILFLLVVTFNFSCSNDLDKSVFEPLEAEILTSHIKNDSSFSDFYDYVRTLADSAFIPKESYTEFESIQYSSLWEYENEFKSTRKKLLENDNTKLQWQKEFANEINSFMQDSMKYMKHINENYYKNFVNIEAEKVFGKMVWVSSYTFVTLNIIPVNGHTIRKISGDVVFVPINEEYDSLSGFLSQSRMKAYFSYTGNSKSRFKEDASTTLPYLDKIEDLPIDIIKQKYNIVFYPNELVIEDRYVDVAFDEVPQMMKSFLLHDFNFYKEMYIQENYNDDYLAFYDHLHKMVVDDLTIKYPLESAFIHQGWEIYNKSKD